MPIRPHDSRISRAARTERGFTLVEILIVVLILGILAAIVIPQFGNASTNAKDASVKSTLALVRGQITLFSAQHSEAFPVLTNTTGWTVMTTWTNTSAATTATANSTSYPYGPYLLNVPINPQNNMTGVTSDSTNNSAGWYYTSVGPAFTFQARDISGNIITTE